MPPKNGFTGTPVTLLRNSIKHHAGEESKRRHDEKHDIRKMADFNGGMFLPVLITGNSNMRITYGWPRLSAFAFLYAIRLFLPGKIFFIYDFINSLMAFYCDIFADIIV